MLLKDFRTYKKPLDNWRKKKNSCVNEAWSKLHGCGLTMARSRRQQEKEASIQGQ
jgi:hypothetical protein